MQWNEEQGQVQIESDCDVRSSFMAPFVRSPAVAHCSSPAGSSGTGVASLERQALSSTPTVLELEACNVLLPTLLTCNDGAVLPRTLR